MGRCVKYFYECAGGHYCDLNKPFLCPDMSCQINFRSCQATAMGRIYAPEVIEYDPNTPNINKISKIYKPANLEFGVLFDAFNAPAGSVFWDKTIKTNAKMTISPISLDELRGVSNKLNNTLATVVKDFYMIAEEDIPYQITIRSTAFTISTKGRWDDFEYFKSPLTVTSVVNSIRRGENSVSNLSVRRV